MTGHRRASAIVAVLLLLGIGVVIAAGVLVNADAASTSCRAELTRTQVRALAWSGVQAVMAELAEQRDSILEGEPPAVTEEWSLFTLDDGTRAVVRLIDLDPRGPSVLAAENSKLDLNTAGAEVIAALPGMSPALAAKVVEARDRQPLSSVEQLLGLEGFSAQLIYGESLGSEPAPADSTLPAAPEAGSQAVEEGGLVALATVFSFDPNVQLGIDGNGDARGSLRINLNQEWSEELGQAIADRLGEAAADVVRGMMSGGRAFESDRDVVQALVDGAVPPEEWGATLDVFTTSPDLFLPGRLDLNHAPAHVLACVPGIEPAQASQIVDSRDSLDTLSRQSPAWPVVSGILTPDEFLEAAGHITTRSMQWRARIEVGFERGGESSLAPVESVPMTLDDLATAWDAPDEAPKLEHRMVFDAVIDIASTRPRVAYLRETTALPAALAMLQADEQERDELAFLTEPRPALEPLIPEEDPEIANADAEGLFLDDAAEFDLFPEAPEDFPGMEPAPAMDEPEEESASEGESAEPSQGVDRRIGRWTTRRAREP